MCFDDRMSPLVDSRLTKESARCDDLGTDIAMFTSISSHARMEIEPCYRVSELTKELMMLCDDLLGVEEYLHLTLLGTIFGSEELYLYRIQCRCRISLSSLQSLHTHECKIIIVRYFIFYRGNMLGCDIDHVSLIGHMDDLQICDACMFYELLTIG